MRWLTYKEAAARVDRDVLTVQRWRRHGMPMSWSTRDGQRVRVVREDVLLAWWRDRLMPGERVSRSPRTGEARSESRA
jgi:phage terminase Nu1 subunit (DNA packaging protein)